MATIKDVARLAGVSVGSVSNVINGKTGNAQLIGRVESAIAELDFKPDRKARSLKSTQNYLVGILLASLREGGMQNSVSVIEQTLQKDGYSVVIKTTDNNAVLENKYIADFIQMGVDGIIVDTGVHEKKWLSSPSLCGMPVVFMEQRPLQTADINIIAVDYEKGISDFIAWCEKKGYARAGLILRKWMVSEEYLKSLKARSRIKISYMFTGENAPESGFKSAYALLNKYGTPDIILAGSDNLAHGTIQAVNILGHKNEVDFACIKSEKWMEDLPDYKCILNIPYADIGKKAAERLLHIINHTDKTINRFEGVLPVLSECSEIPLSSNKNAAGKQSVLKIALLDSATANILQSISCLYTNMTGIKLICDIYSYHDLWVLASDHYSLLSDQYDVIMYDTLWKETLVEKGILAPLADASDTDKEYFRDYIDNLTESYGTYGNKIYGFPFLGGTQLLFCQKYLFEDETLRRQFFQKYGYELAVPATWESYTDVAEFFTREFNPNSPVEFGTCTINSGNIYNSIELLNIMWTYGADFSSEEEFCRDSGLFELALEKYRKIYRYTPKRICSSWEDIANEFMQGSTAMAILYDLQTNNINDSMASKVAGNVLGTMIPGKCPVLGGWSLGCVCRGKNEPPAKDFVKWACGPDCDRITSALSGLSSRRSFYLNHNMEGLYPWKDRVLECYSQSRVRRVMRKASGEDVSLVFYDEIIGKNAADIITGKTGVREGMEKMNSEWKKTF